MLSTQSVAFCTQSARTVCGERFDVMIYDEIEACLMQMNTLGGANAQSIMDSNVDIARHARYVFGLDANVSEATLDFFRTAQRVPVIVDTPTALLFKDRVQDAITCVDGKTKKVSPAACIDRAAREVMNALGATGAPVSIGCSWNRDVKAMGRYLQMSGVATADIMIIFGGKEMSTDDKNAFIREYCVP